MFNGNIVIIGVSTGGPKTLETIFAGLPPLNAAVIIVLHIPSGTDRTFARRLNNVSTMPVTLAEHGSYLQTGHVYLVPGAMHLRLEGNSRLILFAGDRINFVRPSIDVAMTSLSKPLHGRIIGVVLTGMGKDGAEGIRHIKSIGGTTIAQDQDTSAIYGMPKAALQTGAVDFVLPCQTIGSKLHTLLDHSKDRTAAAD
ncbi:chemotaxis protein CheB [Geotalea uraniireducens]|uniref:protein-glutamate methylesterase n=1 Tax=Geotalea uraniireducens TaxID=351604 RepID=A0ABN6VWW2_9BACT|nr:CheB methylesterase domain-containing protein [Geotalea uraniireducens]BDV44919.1 chemotaxis protein CheB [Geotalea uraniireducens]